MLGAMRVPGKHATVVIPAADITADASGFACLGSIHNELLKFTGTDITLDFSRIGSIDTHLGAAIRAVVRRAELRGNVVKFATDSAASAYKDVLSQAAEFRLDQAIEFSRYTKRRLTQDDLAHISAALQRKIIEGANELFSNAALHSASTVGVITSSYVGVADDRFRFVVVDGGKTIPGSVGEAKEYASDDEAIDWAMIPGHTTKRGGIPGGLGSAILQAFVRANGGRLFIVSRKGYWCQTGDLHYSGLVAGEYPGTAVVFDVNLSDRTQYDRTPVVDPRNIW